MTVTASTPQTTRRPDGPPAGLLAVASLALTVVGLVVSALLAGGHVTVSPLGSTAEVARYYLAHRTAAAVSGFFVFGAGVPLGIYAATVYARLLKLGVRVPGPGIGYFGGISASVLVGIAGLVGWVLGQPVTGQSPALIHTLAYVTYALGGVGFVGGVGLLIAGIAVPSMVLGLTPRWFAATGLVLAAVCELSVISLLWSPFSVTLPIGRFIGLAWLIAAGFLLPRNRHQVAG
ncbi:MAG TPA: DUF4386 domain-containing protein [Pseudonocardiaceae bacterium]|nr:DUF4386 domain-containing protein [Pseudonocardiaceae bacterium]